MKQAVNLSEIDDSFLHVARGHADQASQQPAHEHTSNMGLVPQFTGESHYDEFQNAQMEELDFEHATPTKGDKKSSEPYQNRAPQLLNFHVSETRAKEDEQRLAQEPAQRKMQSTQGRHTKRKSALDQLENGAPTGVCNLMSRLVNEEGSFAIANLDQGAQMQHFADGKIALTIKKRGQGSSPEETQQRAKPGKQAKNKRAAPADSEIEAVEYGEDLLEGKNGPNTHANLHATKARKLSPLQDAQLP